MRWGSWAILIVLLVPQRLALAGSDAAADAASQTVLAARDQLRHASIALQRQFEQSPEYQRALLDAQQTYMAYQIAEQEALLADRVSPESNAAQIEIEHLENQLDAARDEAKRLGKIDTPRIDAIAAELLAKRTAVTRHQSQILGSASNLENLRYAWLDATAKVDQMQDDFAAQVRASNQWRSAKSQLEQARTSLASLTP